MHPLSVCKTVSTVMLLLRSNIKARQRLRCVFVCEYLKKAKVYENLVKEFLNYRYLLYVDDIIRPINVDIEEIPNDFLCRIL